MARKRQTQTLKQKSGLKLLPRCVKLEVCRTSAPPNPPNPWRWRWGAACSMPRASDIDGACGISAHHMFLSNCVVQVMRVWSLPAVLSPLAKLHPGRALSSTYITSTHTRKSGVEITLRTVHILGIPRGQQPNSYRVGLLLRPTPLAAQ